jgi:hypothetical protein
VGRLLVRQGLGDSPGFSDDDTGAGTSSSAPDGFVQQVVDLRRRWEIGELPADLNPAYLLFALFAAASAPTVLPHIASGLSTLTLTLRSSLPRIPIRLPSAPSANRRIVIVQESF